jgi:hypothetical protein
MVQEMLAPKLTSLAKEVLEEAHQTSCWNVQIMAPLDIDQMFLGVLSG